MKIKLNINPPTVTAQEHKVKVVHGRPMFYDPPKVREAKRVLENALFVHVPVEPMEGPLSLAVTWSFKRTRPHKHGEWRVTRPDTDNLEKLLKDTMTHMGFWKDDAQVVVEHVEKLWSDTPGLDIEVVPLEVVNAERT